MKVWRGDDEQSEQFIRRLENRARELFPAALGERVRDIVGAVARRGDAALASYVRRFDLKGLEAKRLRLRGTVGGAEDVGEGFVKAVELALANLRAFHEPQQARGYSLELQGSDLSVRVRPLDSVAIYVHGGAAVALSSLLMAVVPARIAGVRRIVVATPPRAFLQSAELRYLLDRLDLREVYLMGGAHAVAALAFGTESVAPVDKIVGRGDRTVAAAKHAVYGTCDVDGIDGPPELVVVADAQAEPALVAADLLAQAEHDPSALAVLVTTSRALGEKVVKLIAARLRKAPRGAAVRAAVRKWGAVFAARDVDRAADLVNRIAPEHVELHVSDPLRVADRIDNAGAIYLGPFTPAVLGDYVAGANHVLPTAGAARFASPLGVWGFVRRTSVVRVAPHRYRTLARAAGALALLENLPMHEEALRAGSRGTL
jgi:histidinol dehydrogenase